TGRVVDDQGEPVTNTWISASLSSLQESVYRETQTDAGGNFDLALYGGRWYFRAAPPSGYLAPRGRTLYVLNGVDQDAITIVLRKINAEITVSISDSSSNP